ncbi:glycosyltransferase family 2 protein [Flavobacterium sp. MAHUQ-51]|uniref:glycosyltransferase family 2 protein n=1 Tax=Flavobacterium sp. GCM10022190 TaxID=3252639 RepID=UPI003620CA98
MKLSIIIPVYNTETYLERCLESVFSQDLALKDYEVIAINDGSTDGSLEILKDFESRYENLIVLSQENEGEAATRNRALQIACGKYITFVDSDDAIEPNTLKTIIKRAEIDTLDMLYLKMNLYDESENWLEELPNLGSESIILNGFEHERRPYPATLYLRELMDGIQFPSNILIGPDSVFNAMVQAKAQKCSYLSIPYYKYTFRLNSLSKQGRSEKAYLGFLNAISVLVNYRNTNYPNYNELQKKYFDNIISIFVTRILQLNILPNLDKNKFLELKALLRKQQLSYLEVSLAKDFQFFDKSYFLFYLYQSTSKKYFEILGQLSKVKRRFIN